MSRIVKIILASLLVVLPGTYWVLAQNNSSPATGQTLHDKLSRTLAAASQNQLQIAVIRESPMAGLLEIELNTGEILFSDRGGDFILTGDMFRTSDSGLINLSAEYRKVKIVDLIANVPVEEMIIYRPEQVKGIITVFTDADCTFCRKLHGDMAQILERGIEVRYMAFPRGGAASAVFPKMISVWCAQDRNRALDQAKSGQNLPDRECDNPVLRHYQIGNQVGISGTPAIVLKDGTVVPGYLDVDRLEQIVLATP